MVTEAPQAKAAPTGENAKASEGTFPGEAVIPEVRDHPAPVISSGGSMLLENTVKIATATRSREIFLVVGNTGFFSPQLLCSSRLYEVDPSPRLWPAAVWLKRTESNFSRCAATHPPKGKATHCILSRLRLLTARLSATHNNLSVASLLQIVFAAVTAVRCAPQAVPPPPSKEGGLWVLFAAEPRELNSQCYSQLFLFNAPISLYAHSATRTKRAPHQGELFL